MERLNTHVCTFDRPLQKTPEILHAVRVYVAVNILLRVIDDLVFVFLVQAVIGQQLIGDNFGTLANFLADDLAQFALAPRSDVMDANLASVAFEQSEYDLFPAGAASMYLLFALVLVHETGQATDEGFISLDTARHFVDASSVHRITDAMSHKPRRLLRDLQGVRDFVATDAVLAVREHPHRAKPLVESDRGILEDRPDLNRELFLTVKTFPHQARFEKRQALGLATRTRWTLVSPLGTGNHFQADLRVRKCSDSLHQATGIFEVNRFHESILS